MDAVHHMKTIAILPSYHDNDNLLKVLRKFEKNVVDEVCLIVDGIDKAYFSRFEDTVARDSSVSIHIIANSERKGIGHAIKQGLKYAMDHDYDVVVVLAANNKDDPTEIPRLLEPICNGEYDYVQGSRFLPGGKRVKNPFIRGVFSRVYPFLWSLSTRKLCTDVTNGFRAYKVSIIHDVRMNIWQNWLDDYQLEYYIHYKVLTLGYRTKEVPVSKTYSYRNKGGYSRIKPFHDWWKIVGPFIYLVLGVKK